MGGGAVFVDPQGTLGGEGFGDVMGFSFFSCSAPAVSILNHIGPRVIVVTNQSHIARGDFSYADFRRRMGELNEELAEHGARWDAVYRCPHSAEDGCGCKKPSPKLLHQAREDFDLDLSKCYFVGDVGGWDMVMADAVGCKGILVRTGLGEGSLSEYRHTRAGIEPALVAADVLEAAGWIVEQEHV